MSKNNQKIQNILDKIKNEMTSDDTDSTIISFDEYWVKKYFANDKNFRIRIFLSDVTLLMSHNQVEYYKELSSYNKYISKIVIPIKKVIRKVVAFLFLPLIADQNKINLSIVRIIKQLRSYINSHYDESANTQVKVHDVQIKVLSEQIAQLMSKIETMEAKKK